VLVTIRDSGSVEPINTQAREQYFRQWMHNLASDDFDAICASLNHHIDTQGGGEIVTSSWIPGSDWRGTPYQRIYEAVGADEDMARFFFGLIVWRVMMDRPETWAFGRYPQKDGDVIGLTYFKVMLR
jgi:hypothetical protein